MGRWFKPFYGGAQVPSMSATGLMYMTACIPYRIVRYPAESWVCDCIVIFLLAIWYKLIIQYIYTHNNDIIIM